MSAAAIRRMTLASAAAVTGRGVHSNSHGTLRVLGAPPGTGFVFRRADLPGSPEVPAKLEFLHSDRMARQTTLARDNVSIATVEHVLSAAAGIGLTDLVLEVDCPEIPFLDGSAAPFVDLFLAAGLHSIADAPSVQPIVIPYPIIFTDSGSGAEICAVPSDEFRISFFFSSNHPGLRFQSLTQIVTPETYRTGIASARTFCFFEEIEEMRRAGLIKGASLASAVVIGRKAVLNESLRYEDEPVRHKVLDLVGDLALLGAPLKGHIMAWRAGHRVNAAFGLHLRKELGL